MKMTAEEAGTAVALDKAAEQAHSSSDSVATKCFESAYGKGGCVINKPKPGSELEENKPQIGKPNPNAESEGNKPWPGKPNHSLEGGIKPELGPKKFIEKEQSGMLEIPPIGKEFSKEKVDGKNAEGKHDSGSPDGELRKDNVAVDKLNGMDKSKSEGGASADAAKHGEIVESLGKKKQVLDGGPKDPDNKGAELKNGTKEGVIKDQKE